MKKDAVIGIAIALAIGLFYLNIIDIMGIKDGENWPTPEDSASYSNVAEFITKSFHLDIELDFEKQLIRGVQTLRIENTKNFLKKVTLDIQGLKINKIYDQQGKDLEYVIRDVNPKFGQALDIEIRELYAKNTDYLIYID